MTGIRRRGAFTLIELLVVIAIIGILAAMVFPVFARARESARKAVCLSNVKNISLAIQMYMADNNDTLFPLEHRQEVFDYFDTAPGGGPGGGTGGEDCELMYTGNFEHANPYLRWAVILDEYVKNRDVWRCPSAKVEMGAYFILPYPDWLEYLQFTGGSWGYDYGDLGQFGPCMGTWPPGWGGAVTDSIVQQRFATERIEGADVAYKAFVQNYAVNGPSWAGPGANELKLAEVDDPVWYVVISDGGPQIDTIGTHVAAYPDLCHTFCVCWGADWENCPWTVGCGLPQDWKWENELRKPYSRHLGGSNLGFLDGHARWFQSEFIMAEGPRYAQGNWSGGIVQGQFQGLHAMGPTYSPTGNQPGDGYPGPGCGYGILGYSY